MFTLSDISWLKKSVLVVFFLSAAGFAVASPSDIPESLGPQHTPNVESAKWHMLGVECSTRKPEGMPCLEIARQRCGGDAEIVSLTGSEEIQTIPMGHGHGDTWWHYKAKYKCRAS